MYTLCTIYVHTNQIMLVRQRRELTYKLNELYQKSTHNNTCHVCDDLSTIITFQQMYTQCNIDNKQKIISL